MIEYQILYDQISGLRASRAKIRKTLGDTVGGPAVRAYGGDMNGAIRVVNLVCPGWGWETGQNATFACIGSVWKSGREKAFVATADDPARALLLSVLKVMAEGAE
jgi:hypothetical protein